MNILPPLVTCVKGALIYLIFALLFVLFIIFLYYFTQIRKIIKNYVKLQLKVILFSIL